MAIGKSHYNKKLKPLARNLRNDSTLGEVLLWSKCLRALKMKGYQFNRQFSMRIPLAEALREASPLEKGAGGIDIIVDFICRKLKLIIEIDGYSHNFKHEKDKIRDESLSELGYTVLRFSELEVRKKIDDVAEAIQVCIEQLEANPPISPFKKGAGGISSPFAKGDSAALAPRKRNNTN